MTGEGMPSPDDAATPTAGAGAGAGRAEPPASDPAPETETAAAGPTVAPVSPDVDLAQDASPLPGVHRGGFLRLPTAPVAVTTESAPAEPGGEFTPDATSWPASESSSILRGFAGWALGFAIVGLVASLFVGWGFPLGVVAVVLAIVALRRPLESRAVAMWAICLGAASILYSAGWLLYAALRANLIG